MTRKGRTWMVAGLATSLFALATWATAQSADPQLNPSPQPAPSAPSDKSFGTGGNPAGNAAADNIWGTSRGGVWIDATRFTHPLSSSSPELTYSSFHYYNSPGSAFPVRYYAPMDDVPVGALVDLITCVYNDSSATNKLSFGLQKYTTDFTTSNRSSSFPGSFTTAGNTGVGYDFINFPTFTYTNRPDGFTLITYHIAVDVSSDTSFAGCWVFYKRQISPAPASASFTDVPTTHPFFQAIEALKASGITGGCAVGQYCPDQFVTRGQMAAFLARALGLNWPN